MVKAIWAVACPAVVMMTLAMVCGGCATAPARGGEAAETIAPAALSADGPVPTATLTASIDPGAAASGALSSAATRPGGGSASQAGPQYRIGAEDVLRVSVWENKELTLDVVVRPDGKISFPLVQDVQAEGLTAAELADVIHQRLIAFIKEPQVSVIVIQVNAPKVFVLGNVARPGPYPLRSDMSVLQALSIAGGFTQFASPRSIKLVRGTGAKQEVRKVNYYDLIDESGEGNYLLKPGDTIVVP